MNKQVESLWHINKSDVSTICTEGWDALVIDEQGKIHDWFFMFRTTDPVFTKFEPDRLYQLEQRLKETLLRILSESGKLWKNLIHIQLLKYSEI